MINLLGFSMKVASDSNMMKMEQWWWIMIEICSNGWCIVIVRLEAFSIIWTSAPSFLLLFSFIFSVVQNGFPVSDLTIMWGRKKGWAWDSKVGARVDVSTPSMGYCCAVHEGKSAACGGGPNVSCFVWLSCPEASDDSKHL